MISVMWGWILSLRYELFINERKRFWISPMDLSHLQKISNPGLLDGAIKMSVTRGRLLEASVLPYEYIGILFKYLVMVS